MKRIQANFPEDDQREPFAHPRSLQRIPNKFVYDILPLSLRDATD